MGLISHDLISQGSFGIISVVKSLENGEEYVLKEVNLGGMNETEQSGAHQEVRFLLPYLLTTKASLLSSLRHPCIVSCIECIKETDTITMVMEYCRGGDLRQRIRAQQELDEPFSESIVLDWFVQICLALESLHDRNILHRDLKTGNVFLTGAGQSKLGDFGISKILNSNSDFAQTVIGVGVWIMGVCGIELCFSFDVKLFCGDDKWEANADDRHHTTCLPRSLRVEDVRQGVGFSGKFG